MQMPQSTPLRVERLWRGQPDPSPGFNPWNRYLLNVQTTTNDNNTIGWGRGASCANLERKGNSQKVGWCALREPCLCLDHNSLCYRATKAAITVLLNLSDIFPFALLQATERGHCVYDPSNMDSNYWFQSKDSLCLYVPLLPIRKRWPGISAFLLAVTYQFSQMK